MTEKRELFPHQKVASAFLTEGGILLVGDPGTGKTLSGIDYLRASGASSCIVLAPSILTTNWVREFKLAESSLTALEFHKVRKKSPPANVYVMSVDSARTKAGQEFLHGRAWDAMIVDECHYLSNPESQRTTSIYDRSLRVGDIRLLSGTPASKHAGQLWPHINRTAPDRIDGMSYEEFTDRYCDSTYKILGGMKFPRKFITGTKRNMVDDLRRRLIGWWLRQKIEDVVDLPGKIYTPVYLPAKAADMSRIMSELDPEVLEAIEFAIETNDGRALSMLDDHVSKLRRLLSIAKAAAVVEYVTTLLESGVPRVSVWSLFRDPLNIIESELKGINGIRTRQINGSVSSEARTQAVDDFQAGKLEVLLCQTVAAGVGITLTAGNRAVFVDESFDPAVNRQASDRHYRIGQSKTVFVDRIILENTIDEAVMAICAKRMEMWERLGEYE